MYSFDESGQLTGVGQHWKSRADHFGVRTLAKKADVNYAVVENPWLGILAKRLLQGKLSQLHQLLQPNPGKSRIA